jgi:hypothetical protein
VEAVERAGMKPRLQFAAAAAPRQHIEPLADLTDRHGAQEERRHRLCLEPLRDAGLRIEAPQRGKETAR